MRNPITRARAAFSRGVSRMVLSQLARTVSDKSNVGWEDLGAFFFGRERTDSGSLPRIDRPYTQSTIYKLAIDKKARSLAGVPLKFYSGPDPKAPEVMQGPVQALLEFPNERMDRFELIQATGTYLELTGECLWALDKIPGPGQLPQEIWPLNPEWCRPILDRDGNLAAWEYTPERGKKVTYLKDEIVFFRHFNPYDMLRGQATLAGGNLSIAADIFSKLANAAFFANDCQPGAVMTKKGTAQEGELEDAKTRWNAKFRGLQKKQAIAFLSGEWDYKTITPTHTDMQFTEQQNRSWEEIASGMGLPPNEAGIMRYLNYATAYVQRRQFWEDCIVPLGENIARRVNHSLLRRYAPGLRCAFDFDDVAALKELYSEKLDNANKAKELGYNLNLIDEVLELGFGPVPWGKEPLVSIALMPVSEVLSGAGAEDSGAAAQTASQSLRGSVFALQRIADEVLERKEVEKLVARAGPDPALLESARAGAPRWRSLFEGEQRRASYWKTYQARLLPLERRYGRLLRGVFEGWKQEVLEKLVKSGIGQATAARNPNAVKLVERGQYDETIEALLFDELDGRHRIQVVSRPVFGTAIQYGIDQVLADLELDPADHVVRPKADSLNAQVVKVADVTETVRQDITEALNEGFDAGESITDLSHRVGDVFDASFARTRLIARTEVGIAASTGKFEGMQQLGIERHEWLSSRDEKVRDDHVTADGEVVAIGELFPTVNIRYPLDPEGPPEQICGCRCVALPVAKED